PTHAGPWLVSDNGRQPYIWVIDDQPREFSGFWFLPLPIPPLPKSRTVALTAKVFKTFGGWNCQPIIDGVLQSWGPIRNTATADEQIKWVRETYGIEPEVQA